MDYYFLIITIIDVFVLGIMCVLTKYNETLNLQQRRWFISSFILIISISILEVVTVPFCYLGKKSKHQKCHYC